jgi:hypothetical protein
LNSNSNSTKINKVFSGGFFKQQQQGKNI